MEAKYLRDVVAEAWRGQITPRKLRVLIDGLGDDDPRLLVDGRRWPPELALLWAAIGEIKRMTVQTSLSLGNKKVGTQVDHPDYPWRESQNQKVRQVGDRGGMDSNTVRQFLDNLTAPRAS